MVTFPEFLVQALNSDGKLSFEEKADISFGEEIASSNGEGIDGGGAEGVTVVGLEVGVFLIGLAASGASVGWTFDLEEVGTSVIDRG